MTFLQDFENFLKKLHIEKLSHRYYAISTMNDTTKENSGEKENSAGNNKKNSKSLVKKGLSLSLLTFLSRIFGLAREMTKSKFLGTSSYSDAFATAFMIPNLCRRLFAENAVSVAFIPTFKDHLENSEKSETQKFINATFTLVTFLTTVFVTAGIILTPLIVRIFFPKENIDVTNETEILTRIMFPYLIVISIAALFQGILNGLKIFSPSGFTPILFNVIVILSTYILSPHTANPARAMAIGSVTGGTVQALFQLPFVLKNNWKIQFTTIREAFTNPGTRKVISLVIPTIVGMAAYQLNDIVSTSLATHAGVGVASSLQFSLRLQELILGICAVTIGTVILPDLTGFAKKNMWKDFNTMLEQSIRIIAFIAIPITFYSLIMGKSMITLLYASGKFGKESIDMTTKVFFCHIAGLFFIAVNRIISPAFYAQENPLFPTVAGLTNFASDIIFALILVGPMKGPGIATALTIASAINTVTLFVFLKYAYTSEVDSNGKKHIRIIKNNNIDVRKLYISTVRYSIRMIVFSIIAAIPTYFLRELLSDFFAGHHKIISQGIPITITAIVFGAIGLLLMVATRDPIIVSLKKKFMKR